LIKITDRRPLHWSGYVDCRAGLDDGTAGRGQHTLAPCERPPWTVRTRGVPELLDYMTDLLGNEQAKPPDLSGWPLWWVEHDGMTILARTHKPFQLMSGYSLLLTLNRSAQQPAT
jgi:hypothetical protein